MEHEQEEKERETNAFGRKEGQSLREFLLFQINQHERQTDHLRKQGSNRRTMKSDEVDKNRIKDRVQNR